MAEASLYSNRWSPEIRISRFGHPVRSSEDASPNRLRKKAVSGASDPIRRLLHLRNSLILLEVIPGASPLHDCLSKISTFSAAC
jgi:hypothetical protein